MKCGDVVRVEGSDSKYRCSSCLKEVEPLGNPSELQYYEEHHIVPKDKIKQCNHKSSEWYATCCQKDWWAGPFNPEKGSWEYFLKRIEIENRCR